MNFTLTDKGDITAFSVTDKGDRVVFGATDKEDRLSFTATGIDPVDGRLRLDFRVEENSIMAALANQL